MSTELEALLESERQLGTYESTGVFTLSLQEARRKLAQYQLGSLEMAVLKLIQALVQLEPVAVWIDCDDQSFTLNWADAHEALEPQQFVGDLERVILGEAGPARDMAIGLLGFLSYEPEQVWWCHWEGLEAREVVALAGNGQAAQVQTPLGRHRTTYALSVRAGARPLTLARATIAQRILFAPVAILWNGRLMCDLSWNPPGYAMGQVPYWADFYFALDAPVREGLALKPIGPCKHVGATVDKTQWKDFARASDSFIVSHRYMWGNPTRPLHFSGRRPALDKSVEWLTKAKDVQLNTYLGESIWVVNGTGYAPSVLLCVKHGVILNPCRLPIFLSGLVVVMSTPYLEVDLSQFTPVENSESWAGVVERLHLRYGEVVRNIKAAPPKPYNVEEHVPLSLVLAGLAGAALGAVLFPYSATAVIAGSLLGFNGVKKWVEAGYRKRVQEMEEASLKKLGFQTDSF